MVFESSATFASLLDQYSFDVEGHDSPDKIPLKNTFIHFGEPPEPPSLVRARTDPTTPSDGFGRHLGLVGLDGEDTSDALDALEHSFGNFGAVCREHPGSTPAGSESDEEEREEVGHGSLGAAALASAGLGEVSSEGSVEEQAPSSEAPEEAPDGSSGLRRTADTDGRPPRGLPVPQQRHDVWTLEARKLRSRDKVQSHTFAVTLPQSEFGARAREVHFVMMIRAKMTNRRRGGGSFSASKGVGFIEVKCAEDFDMYFHLSVVIGGDGQPSEDMQPRCLQHNFHQTTLCRIPGEVNFVKVADVARGTLSLGLHVQPCCSFQIAACQPWAGLPLWVPASWGSIAGDGAEGDQDGTPCGAGGLGWSSWADVVTEPPSTTWVWAWAAPACWQPIAPAPATAAVDTARPQERDGPAMSSSATATPCDRQVVQYQ